VLFDAVLLLSFGGPEGTEQVRPFLENVTRGRGVPPERLDEVAEHYLHFGGVSPINRINLALLVELRAELIGRGLDLPVYFGNRNWEPYVEDVVATMRDNRIRRAAVFTTSAWSGYSSCAQYVEDIARARRMAGEHAPELVKLRPYFDHPLFVEMFAEALAAAADTLPAELRDETRLVFTAHSIPVAADQRCGPRLYSRQVAYAARLVAAAAGYSQYDLVWQSRSGPLQVPWLEPDVADHLSALADINRPNDDAGQYGPGRSRTINRPNDDAGRYGPGRSRTINAVVVCPIGFVADHIEVVWDLDHELRSQAEAAGIAFARARTPNADRRLAQMAVDLISELQDGREPARVAGPDPVPGCGASINGEPCRPPHCVAEDHLD
jgi:protoporphyrin/coproporphyrin ferrochelatase